MCRKLSGDRNIGSEGHDERPLLKHVIGCAPTQEIPSQECAGPPGPKLPV